MNWIIPTFFLLLVEVPHPAKSEIVNIVEKYSLRGKEFKDYVASLQEDNVIEFPTSKTASRK